MHYFICAGFGYADIAPAFVDRPLISEELQWVVEDFYGVGGALDELVGGLVEAVCLEGIGGFEHKIPVNVRPCRVLLNNEFFTFLAHLDVL